MSRNHANVNGVELRLCRRNAQGRRHILCGSSTAPPLLLSGLKESAVHFLAMYQAELWFVPPMPRLSVRGF